MPRLLLTAAFFISLGGPAMAGNSLLMQDGISRAQAFTLHCTSDNVTTTACGVPSQPLVVAPVSGGATAGNQAAEIAGQQVLLQSIGGQLDNPYPGSGAGSMVALLKSLFAILTNGVAAIPVGGQPVSRSKSLNAATSTVLFSPNSARRYLAFQAPPGTAVWVNFVGGIASPNCLDCAMLPAGTLFESGNTINQGAITVYSPVATPISAWEE